MVIKTNEKKRKIGGQQLEWANDGPLTYNQIIAIKSATCRRLNESFDFESI